MSRDVTRLLARCQEAGCRVRRTRGGHWQVLVPGGPIVVTGGTPSDHRAVRNFTAALRRAGLDV